MHICELKINVLVTERVCVCSFVRERKRVCVCKQERESVCEQERKSWVSGREWLRVSKRG